MKPSTAPTKTSPSQSTAPFRVVLRHWWSLEEESPGKRWQYWIATAFYNTAIGLVLSIFFILANPRSTLMEVIATNLLYSHSIGFCIHLAFETYYAVTRAAWRKALPRAAHQAIHIFIPVGGVLVGYILGFALNGRNFLSLLVQYPRGGVATLMLGMLISLIWYLVMDGQTRRLRAEADEARARADAEALQKQASEAELRALQAQIEPHFLFNTLANVQALIDYEPAKAKHMLETFIDYLRATLDASRRTQATLGDEIALLQRYMELMQVRMGARLKAVWDVPSDLQTHPFAPLLLQPLIENAIKYGLEPKIEGGTITVQARESNGRITITVQDDGLGLGQPSSARKSGAGAGLKNVEARLRSTFGADANVTIRNLANGPDSPSGCCATVAFPDHRLHA